MRRLDSLEGIPATVAMPRYDREAHGAGIVHLGLGAFVRAHLAVYTDDALAASGGDWRLVCIGLRSRASVDAISAQHGLYTLLIRDRETTARIPGSLAHPLHAPSEHAAVMEALCAPTTRVVSLTITEKGYGIDAATGGLNVSNPGIADDLASDLSAPQSAVGLIVAALARRRESGMDPFTVLSCDNLPENGQILKRLVLEFAERVDAALAAWIGENVTFPSTMVDRITPPQTENTRSDAEAWTGRQDLAAIETEPFTQWVIEDDFCAGRPAWEQAGAVMVSDVRPYERMKLTMLNGTHSMLAYTGFLAGHSYVRDTVADPALKRLIERHLQTAAVTLDAVPGIDLDDYAQALVSRFSNPAIAHPTHQIAMDGTLKLPTRIFDPSLVAIERGLEFESFAFTTAAWMAYVCGARDEGQPYDLRDPREAELLAAVDGAGRSGEKVFAALAGLPGLIPRRLAAHGPWRESVCATLDTMLGGDMGSAIDAAARS